LRQFVLITAQACTADQGIARLLQASSESDGCLNALVQNRHSIRAFAPQPVSLAEVAKPQWAAQGIRSREGIRTAPAEGGL